MLGKIKPIIYVIVLYAISELIFVRGNMYTEFYWLDTVMHFIGGVLIANLGYRTFNIKNYWHLLIFVIVIGVLWEVYEYILDIIAIRQWAGVYDTLGDIIMDIIGMYTFKLIKKYE